MTTDIFDSLEVLREDIVFNLPFKTNEFGFYKILPNRGHIGGKNSLRDLQAKKTKKGYLYFIRIENTNKYKIGVSSNSKRRLSDISSLLPFELDILAINQINNPYQFEQDLINKYQDQLIRNEWFEFTIQQAKNIMILLHNQKVKESIYG